jgi:hypothetical protein
MTTATKHRYEKFETLIKSLGPIDRTKVIMQKTVDDELPSFYHHSLTITVPDQSQVELIQKFFDEEGYRPTVQERPHGGMIQVQVYDITILETFLNIDLVYLVCKYFGDITVV